MFEKIYVEKLDGGTDDKFILVSPDIFGEYWASLHPMARFCDPSIADRGLSTLKFAGADVIACFELDPKTTKATRSVDDFPPLLKAKMMGTT